MVPGASDVEEEAPCKESARNYRLTGCFRKADRMICPGARQACGWRTSFDKGDRSGGGFLRPEESVDFQVSKTNMLCPQQAFRCGDSCNCLLRNAIPLRNRNSKLRYGPGGEEMRLFTN